jgi:hypothetical protein
MKIVYSILILTAFGFFYGCGDKLDLSQFPITNNGGTGTVSETTYVQQSPTWNQFNAPEDVLIGNEPVVYVADTKNNRVVQLDLSGAEIGSLSFLNPRALAQDNNFDLLVIADTVSPLNDTLSVVIRLRLSQHGGIISSTPKTNIVVSDYPTPVSSRKRRFTGITTLADNSFYVTRTGPDNNSALDPDNAILKIKGTSSVEQLTVLQGFQITGNGVYSIDRTSSIAALPNNNTDFVITRATPDFGFKVLWFEYDEVDGVYNPKFLPESSADIVRLQIGVPEDVTIDNNRNIFVVDSERDSLYKYNSSGRLMGESFGGEGLGDNQLNSPKGVAFFNKVLYIADTGNNRIVRYKLSTDLN